MSLRLLFKQTLQSASKAFKSAMKIDLLWRNTRAASNSTIGIIVTGLMASFFLPMAIVRLSNETLYSGANADLITICCFAFPALLVIGLAYKFIPRGK